MYRTLPFLNTATRKALLTCVRVQALPPHPRLKSLPSLSTIVVMEEYPRRQVSVMDEIVPLFEPVVQSPLLSGFASMLLRTTPYVDQSCLYEELNAGIWKEIHATQSDDRPQVLNYETIFRHHHIFSSSLSSFHRPTPFWVRHRLTVWKESLRGQVLIPEVSDKTVGREARTSYLNHNRIPLDRLPHLPISTIDIARQYEEEGALSPGVVEVRYAFFFTDLKPRIYYAMGPTAWYHSQYIWKVADSLQRVFATTNPETRYMAHRLNPLDPNQLLFIYDYTSFTSNMAELKYFLYDLAEFCEDIPVQILDLHYGLQDTTLGRIIHDYNLSINVDHPFDLGPILGEQEPLILVSRLAGLLGIYGNIVFSTTLAGINLMCLVGDEDKANTVGDDSEAKEDESPGRWKELVAGVRCIGDVEQGKFEVFRHRDTESGVIDSWHFLKRPFRRSGDIIETGYMLDWPMISLVLDCTSKVHTEKFESLVFRRKKFVTQTARFLTLLEEIPQSPVEYDVEFAYSYLRWAYSHLNLPKDGRLPGHSRVGCEHLAIPAVDVVPDVGWIEYLAQRKSHMGAALREPQAVEETRIDGVDWVEGDVFIKRGSAGLGLASRMGVVESKPLWQTNYYPKVTVFQLTEYIQSTARPLYEHTVVRDPPKWFHDAICLLP
jgi:hypothetical protein